MPRILCIGDLMLDVMVLIDSQINYGSDTKASITTHGGGAAANTATWLAAQGNEVFFVSRAGSDAAADTAIAELDAWGISHKELRIKDTRTGVVVVIVDETGQRTMFPDSGANSGLGISDLPELSGFDAAFLSGYSLFNEASTIGVEQIIKEIRNSGIPLFFDPASVGTMSAFGKSRVLSYLNQIDVLLLNEDEALFLTDSQNYEQALSKLSEIVNTVIIKLSDKGAIGKTIQSDTKIVPADYVPPVDTTGAGDAFAAGFIPEWITTNALESAILAGNQLAAKCVANIGARPSVNPK